MKTIIKNISLLLCAAVTLASCERKPISDICVCSNTLSIPIDIDWETSGITLQNVTVIFYNSEDGSLAYEHTYEHNSDEIQSYAYLPEGSYTAVIFNELRDQIDYVSCVGYDNLSTLKFESNDDDPLRSRSTTRSYVEQSGELAVATVEDIVVTTDMIAEAAAVSISSYDGTKSSDLSSSTRSTVESLMGVTALKKNTTINITAHIKNIYYALMPSLVDLINVADGYYVYSDQNSSTTSTLQFTMNNRTYDTGSYFDGTISTSVTTFGTLEDRTSTSGHDDSTPVTLDILFMMIDEDQTEENLTMDVTSIMTHEEQSDGSVIITIDAYFDESLPEVVPAGSSGDSGFGSSVEEWGDMVDVPLS